MDQSEPKLMMELPSIEEQSQFYDEKWVSEEYANRIKLSRCVAILDALRGFNLDLPKIIELGCGTGWLTSILGHFGPATGVELSSRAVDAARRRFPHVNFEAVDLTRWDPPPEACDVVVSHEVLEHLSDQKPHLEQVSTLLRPGGYLILTTPSLRTMNAMSEERRRTWSEQPIENWISRGRLRSLALESGLIPLKLTTLVPGHGTKGSYYLVNSAKLTLTVRYFGLGSAWDALRLACGYGLHHFLVARRSSASLKR